MVQKNKNDQIRLGFFPPRKLGPLLGFIGALGTLACGPSDSHDLKEDPDGSAAGDKSNQNSVLSQFSAEAREYRLEVNKDVDILFVVDNSGSMAEEQARLASNFAAFTEILEEEGVDANYRISVTSTDMGASRCASKAHKGLFRRSSCLDRKADFIDPSGSISRYNTACTSVCSLSQDELEVLPTMVEGDSKAKARAWIERINGQSNLKNQEISTAQALACIGPQGISGCGYEAPLNAMYVALRRARGGEDLKPSDPNFGFMRPAASLAVVHITDEVDCSINLDNRDWAKVDEVFDRSNETFWVKGQQSPSSAICLSAGVRCVDEPGAAAGIYSSCEVVDRDVNGSFLSPQEAKTKAVLSPVSKYIDFLRDIRREKKKLNPNADVFVSLIGGVTHQDGSIVYRHGYDGSAEEQEHHKMFGLGYGCTGQSSFLEEEDPNGQKSVPGGMGLAVTVPPVRIAAVIEAVNGPSKGPHSQAMFPICNDDYTGPLRKLAEKIRTRLPPACHPQCVKTMDEKGAPVGPKCAVFETREGQEKQSLVECRRGEDGAYLYDEVRKNYLIPDGATTCYALLSDRDGQQSSDAHDNLAPECLAQKKNLEIRIQRDKPAVGAKISAICEPSLKPELECGSLG